MIRRCSLAMCIAVVATMLSTTLSVAQQNPLKQQLVGAWTLVSSSTKLPDGSPVWGANPIGLLIFTESGQYSSQVMRSDRPKFAVNSRIKGTPEENQAAVHGAISSFGTYTVDEAAKTFTISFIGSTFPNLQGTQQTRPAAIAGDELRITNPSPSVGGPASELVYRRAKQAATN